MSIHPNISVIMPVYNVEAYVARAIESVLNQTLTSFEFIIVDDGSSDETGAICDRFADRDARIQVFHQENAGAAAARNFAMEHAHGDYLFFFDSDDWAEPHMLEEMYDFGVANDLQLVVAGFYIDTYCYGNETDCFRQVLNVPTHVFASQEEFRKSAAPLFDKNQFYPPWNKLYLRSYIEEHHLQFPITFWDDFPFILSILRDVERVGVIETPYYHFIRARAESETSRYRPDMYNKREEEHAWMLDLYDHWGVTDDENLEVIYRRYAERLVGCIENVICPDSEMTRAEQKAAVRSMIQTPQAQKAAAKSVPHTTMMRIMLWPIKGNRPWIAYMEGRFISFVKRHSSQTFSKLKARR